MDLELPLPTCRRADGIAIRILKTRLELPGMAEESSFFEEGFVTERCRLLHHQRAQDSSSTGVGGFGMSSVEARRMSASVWNLVATLHEVLGGLSGSLGEKVRWNLPELELVTSILEGLRGL